MSVQKFSGHLAMVPDPTAKHQSPARNRAGSRHSAPPSHRSPTQRSHAPTGLARPHRDVSPAPGR
ncbi:hypothetical protein TOK_4235 [Pseudonocardia sp. N23]|nr:hypothetical protein TOK_4235 [Pseudonocardia sp. N23]